MHSVNEIVPLQNKARQMGEGEFVKVFKNAVMFVNSCLTPVSNKHWGEKKKSYLIFFLKRQYHGLHTIK